MNPRAAAFLDRFRRADRDNALLDVLVDDYDGLFAAIEAAPDAVLAAAASATADAGPPAGIHLDSFASACCDRNGRVIVADQRFIAWLGGLDPLAAVVRRVGADRPSVSTIADDRSGRPVAVAAATEAIAARWPLADTVRAALASTDNAVAVVAFRPDGEAWDRAARAYGLSRQQSRLAEALARRGNLRDAADATGLAYESARKLVGQAMDKVGAARQTDLVRRVLTAAAGDLRAPEGGTRLFADLFGLSARQATLAQAVAHGATREAAAAALAVSRETAKAEMKVVFQACGVANAVDLARIAAEVDALAGLATACSIEIAPRGGDGLAEPLRLIARRRAPGSIAVTDHGPARGRPLLMFHPAVGGRHQPRRLVAALQAAGWRPIGFDRPGFGLTDMIDGADPFAEAGLDAVDIVAALGLDRVTLFGRTASAATLATAAAMPDRIASGILVAPDPPAHEDLRSSGMMGRGKALFFGNRALATAFARILSKRTSSAQIARMQRQSVAGSAIDEAVLDDPEHLADIVRASRQSALGLHGFLAEMQAHGRSSPAPLACGKAWTVIVGAHDPLYDIAATQGCWARLLPGSALLSLPDGGRWLHLTHTAAVVAALAPTRPR